MPIIGKKPSLNHFEGFVRRYSADRIPTAIMQQKRQGRDLGEVYAAVAKPESF